MKPEPRRKDLGSRGSGDPKICAYFPKNISELIGAIDDYIKGNITHSRPFVWTRSVAEIILKVNRGRNALKMTPLQLKGAL